MLRNVLLGAGLGLVLMFVANSAQAIGVYADVPLKFTLKDCTQDCSYNPSGIKAGVVLPSNVGIGVQSYKIEDQGTSVDYTLVDVSYLLPIPVVNIMLGLGGGGVSLDSGGSGLSGRATNLWASFGFPILPLLDLHVGYHKVTAVIHDNAFDYDLGGTMLSFGVMLNF